MHSPLVIRHSTPVTPSPLRTPHSALRSSSILLLLLALPLFAQNTEGFESRVNAGLTLTRGNSETSLLTLGAETKRVSDTSELTAGTSYTYGQNTIRRDDGSREDNTTVDKADANTQYNYLYTEKTYGLFTLSALSDEIARIDYRLLAGPGLGHYLVRNDVWTLSGEVGAAVLAEKVAEDEDNYMVLRAAQNYERKLNDHARIWQKLEYLPRAREMDSYLLNGELGAEARLNGNLSLRVVLQSKYDSTPAVNTKGNNMSLVAGVSYSW